MKESIMITDLVARTSDQLLRVARSLESLPPLLARLVVGFVFATSGWGKAHSLEKVTAFFTELHIPAPAFQATFVSYVELIGGALVLFLLAFRFVSTSVISSLHCAR